MTGKYIVVSLTRVAVVVVALLGAAATTVTAQEGRFSFRSGMEYVEGDYGGPIDLSDWYVPFTLLYERKRGSLRLTVPYLEREFADLINGQDATQLERTTESGLGDVIAAITVYDVVYMPDAGIVVDLTGKAKLATADEAKGLGTGANDYSLQADIYKFFDRVTLTGMLGYKIRGEPSNMTLDDTWMVSAGAAYRFSPATSGGLFLDYRQSSILDFESIREITVLFSQRVNERWHAQAYLVRGFSDSSIDLGGGFSIRQDF